MISVLYLAHNRLEYTMMTFPPVLFECINPLVVDLWVFDDNSTDGTSEFLQNAIYLNKNKLKIHYVRKKIGNSTQQLNEVCQNTEAEYIAKIDNDILILPQYLETLYGVSEKKENLDIAFLAPTVNGEFPPKLQETLTTSNAAHIGGIGLFRRKVFLKYGAIKSNKRFFGFTVYQKRALRDGWKACWLGGLEVVDLDGCAIYSKVRQNVKNGWSRNLFPDVCGILDGSWDRKIKML
jgi:glycosyltransferase involved in cell wall biosynthesis